MQEIKELKQQLAYKQNELDSKERELNVARKEVVAMYSENEKYKERVEQLSTIVKSKQNESSNMGRQMEDLKHQVVTLKSELRSLS